jgi:hypothetical protein
MLAAMWVAAALAGLIQGLPPLAFLLGAVYIRSS